MRGDGYGPMSRGGRGWDGHDSWSHMHDGWGWGGWLLMILFFLLLAALIVGVVIALVVLGVLFVVALIAMWRLQERIVWQPPRLAAYPSVEARRIDYRADDGQPLFAFVVGEPARAPGVIIAFHGNADLAVWKDGNWPTTGRLVAYTPALGAYPFVDYGPGYHRYLWPLDTWHRFPSVVHRVQFHHDGRSGAPGGAPALVLHSASATAPAFFL